MRENFLVLSRVKNKVFATQVKIKEDIVSLNWDATALIEYVALSEMSRVNVKYGDCEFRCGRVSSILSRSKPGTEDRQGNVQT